MQCLCMNLANGGTEDGVSRLVTYGEWSQLLQNSFEKCYYVPEGM